MKSKKGVFLALDVGGTFAKVFVFSWDRTPLLNNKFLTPSRNTDPFTWWRQLFDQALQLVSEADIPPVFFGLGLALPGTYHYPSHVMVHSPNIPILNKRNILEDCAKILPPSLRKAQLTFMNDADAAGLGIAHAFNQKTCVTLTLGTGCGSAIVIKGHLWVGQTGFGSETGHATLDPNSSRVCGCGKHGCVEAFVGELGLRQTAREIGPKTHWPTEHIGRFLHQKATKKSPEAQQVLTAFGQHIGAAIANHINMFGITEFFLTGGISTSFSFFEKGIQTGLRANQFAFDADQVHIRAVPPDLGNFAAQGLLIRHKTQT